MQNSQNCTIPLELIIAECQYTLSSRWLKPDAGSKAS